PGDVSNVSEVSGDSGGEQLPAESESGEIHSGGEHPDTLDTSDTLPERFCDNPETPVSGPGGEGCHLCGGELVAFDQEGRPVCESHMATGQSALLMAIESTRSVALPAIELGLSERLGPIASTGERCSVCGEDRWHLQRYSPRICAACR